MTFDEYLEREQNRMSVVDRKHDDGKWRAVLKRGDTDVLTVISPINHRGSWQAALDFIIAHLKREAAKSPKPCTGEE